MLKTVVAYQSASGEVRGVVIHEVIHPNDAIAELTYKISRSGLKGIYDWIEAGIAYQGYAHLSSVTPQGVDQLGKHSMQLPDSEEYGYLILRGKPSIVGVAEERIVIFRKGQVIFHL